MKITNLKKEIKLTQSDGTTSTIDIASLQKDGTTSTIDISSLQKKAFLNDKKETQHINLNPLHLFNQGLMLDKSIPSSEVMNLINLIKKNYEAVKLIRIGGVGDGGYLFPDIFREVSYNFSPGVSKITSFEEHLANEYDIKTFLADASVDNPPIEHDYFEFTKKFLGSQTNDNFFTLSKWLELSGVQKNNDLFLQMDIEGFELDVLIKEDMKILKKFVGMIIEFHWLHKIFERNSFKMFNAIFSKLLEEFCIVHIHPNNCCGLAFYENVSIPRVAEFSFLRRDYLDKVLKVSELSIPNELDAPNTKHNQDIVLPSIWWKK